MIEVKKRRIEHHIILYHGATIDIKVPSRGSFAENNVSSSSDGLVGGGVEVEEDIEDEYDGDAAAAAAIFWMDLGDMMVVE
ncbi:hypothetical protein OSB04_025082 [Centaurea solstitialis]|uniref:Uncharacterized protein n=1 Tax=Centaurea solstitialis TaxID=347529 RepID=A0AA38WB08_9ASTR|nr:hypothetical protein OSB04_025082 [Centaurea solstitialis]